MVSVALTSMHGEQLMYAHPQQTHELDLKGMNPGIYLLQISDGKAFAYHKLIIL